MNVNRTCRHGKRGPRETVESGGVHKIEHNDRKGVEDEEGRR